MRKYLEDLGAWVWVALLAVAVVFGVVTIIKTAKNWLTPSPTVRTYAAPVATKRTRPVGIVYLTTTGDDQSATKWYLRADTVLGPRTKRLFWIKLDFSENKTVKYHRDEQFIALNCETMETRMLKAIFYKRNEVKGYSQSVKAFDKAEIDYPTPNTGMMAVFKEVCRDVYDQNI